MVIREKDLEDDEHWDGEFEPEETDDEVAVEEDLDAAADPDYEDLEAHYEEELETLEREFEEGRIEEDEYEERRLEIEEHIDRQRWQEEVFGSHEEEEE